MEEAGHPPIKIKFKRLASSINQSQTVSQPESGDNQPHHPTPLQPARHELAGDCSHPTLREHAVGGQMVEAMLVDQLFQPGPNTLPHSRTRMETWTQAMDNLVENITHRKKTGTPDSPMDRSHVHDTIMGPDTHDPLTHVRANQVYNEGCISSS